MKIYMSNFIARLRKIISDLTTRLCGFLITVIKGIGGILKFVWKALASPIWAGIGAIAAIIALAVFLPSIQSWISSTLPYQCQPFEQGEVGILIGRFEEYGNEEGLTVNRIVSRLEEANIPYINTNRAMTTREDARALSNQCNATIVIWGERSSIGIEVEFEITPRFQLPEQVLPEVIAFSVEELSHYNTWIFYGVDIEYLVYFLEGQVHYFNQNYTLAESKFLLALGSANSEIAQKLSSNILYFYLGNCQLFQERPDNAIESYNRSIELNSLLESVFNNRGVAFYMQRKYQQAFSDFDKAIEIKPDYALGYNNRAMIFFEQGSIDEAKRDLTHALSLQSDYPDALHNMTIVSFDIQEEIDSFNEGRTNWYENNIQSCIQQSGCYAPTFPMQTVQKYMEYEIRPSLSLDTKVEDESISN